MPAKSGGGLGRAGGPLVRPVLGIKQGPGGWQGGASPPQDRLSPHVHTPCPFHLHRRRVTSMRPLCEKGSKGEALVQEETRILPEARSFLLLRLPRRCLLWGVSSVPPTPLLSPPTPAPPQAELDVPSPGATAAPVGTCVKHLLEGTTHIPALTLTVSF